MDQRAMMIVIAIGVLVVIAVLGAIYARSRRTQRLRQRFGPEYDQVVREQGSRRSAEGVLEWRAKRRQRLQIRPLTQADHGDFADRWRNVQSRFVDDPKAALAEADDLVNRLLDKRGYPVADFDQQAADLSVDYPVVVQNYRAAHAIAVRNSRGQANTEELRRAMVHYRSLFDELLKETYPDQKEALG